MKDEWLNVNTFFEQQKNFFHQEILLHNFLRFTVPLIEAALFKTILNQKSNEDVPLPPELITCILQYYYLLNIEIVVAQKTKLDCLCHNKSAENKQQLRRYLITNPEPHLLWGK
jgi:hypothetical protein